MEHSGSAAKVAGTLLLGAVVGGILGVLFAPAKGSDTRKKLMSKKDDLTDAMKDKINQFISDVKSEFEGAKEKAAGMVESAKGK